MERTFREHGFKGTESKDALEQTDATGSWSYEAEKLRSDTSSTVAPNQRSNYVATTWRVGTTCVLSWITLILLLSSMSTALPIPPVFTTASMQGDSTAADRSQSDGQSSKLPESPISVVNSSEIWSMLDEWTEFNESAVWENWTSKFEDEFKGWKSGFKLVGRSAKHLGKKAHKALRSAGKYLKKHGARAWTGIKKFSKKAFKFTKAAVQQGLNYGSQAYGYYQEWQYMQGGQVPVEPIEGQVSEYDTDPGDGRSDYDESRSRDGGNKNWFGDLDKQPKWVYFLVAVLVVVLIVMAAAWLFVGGKADYRHRRNVRHKRRNQRGGRRSESDSDDSEDEETQAVTQMTTMTEAPTMTQASTATSAITMTTMSQPIQRPKGKKKRGIRKALDKIEQSIYAPKKKKGGKGKKKKMEQSAITELPTTTAASTVAASQVQESTVTKATEAEEEEEEKPKAKSKSKSKPKSKAGKKSAAKKKKGK